MKIFYLVKFLIKSILLATLAFITSFVNAGPMEDLIQNENFWKEVNKDNFMKNYKSLGFRWTSDAMDSARSSREGMTFHEKSIGETIVYFAKGNPSQIQISIHNRGDDLPMEGSQGRDQFNVILREWAAILTEVSGVEMVKRGKDNKSAVKANGAIWTSEDQAYLLEYSSIGKTSDFQSQFIRLRIAPVVKKTFIEEKLDTKKMGPVAKESLPRNVKRIENEVYIANCPMVDQGTKGYCVTATASRVFGYLGLQVTMHELAQLAGSDPSQGTNVEKMVEAISKLTGRFKTRMTTHIDMNYKDMEKLTMDYNRVAKRAGMPEVPDSEDANKWDNFDSFDPEILRSARTKSKTGIGKFEREIKRNIDSGIPLLWNVTLGIYPEPKRISQTRGGHMRLIIGYNEKDKQVIFSDSWGAGHEKKLLPLEDAYCMTKGIFSIRPIK
tara:strand:+ start:1182 stop:2501 length:1320 start_codon:yes stop_codon:yes gene_type:complete